MSHQTNTSISSASPSQHPSTQAHPPYPTSPPLPNLHALSISPPYAQYGHHQPQSPDNAHTHAAHDFRYSGVFGPPAGVGAAAVGAGASPTLSHGWGLDKRGSRGGLPTNWYDPPPSHSPSLPSPFDPYRNPSPALSPPTSSSSGGPSASASSANPYLPHQPPPYPEAYHAGAMGAIGLANTPSPPPMPMTLPFNMGFGMASGGSAPNLALHGHGHGGMPAYGSQSLANIAARQQGGQGGGGGGGWRNSYTPPNAGPSQSPVGGSGADEDVIPTAIVIKNIPFSVPRESLLSIIESLGAPLPYAFNYHHDSGIFRGLAFANFRAADEAAAVVAALNGYDVSGRKLRVEYKKVLQPGEKDRIEREKALKRMRSVQGFDKPNGAQVGDMGPPPVPAMPLPSLRSVNGYANGGMGMGMGMGMGTHASLPSFSQSSAGSANAYSQQMNGYHPDPYSLRPSTSASGGDPYLSHSQSDSPPHSAISTSTSSHSQSGTDPLPTTLDMNDPIALDIYSRCLLFKEDRMRDELSFSRNLSAHERRVVHLVAGRLGLYSGTKEGDEGGKCVVVSKDPAAPASATAASRPPLTTSASASATTAISSNYLSPYGTSPYNADLTTQYLSSPGSGLSGASPVYTPGGGGGLRIKKSMPDLRGFNSALFGRELANGQSKGLAGQRSSGNLREAMSLGAAAGRRMNGFGGADVPPVPALPTGLGGNGLNHRASFSSHTTINGDTDSTSSASAPTRHPRGPAGESRGFSGTSGGLGDSPNIGSAGAGLGPGGRGLRASASIAVMRHSPGFGSFGRGVREEDEDAAGAGAPTGAGEGVRTRESLDI